jgi:hypothetical protein
MTMSFALDQIFVVHLAFLLGDGGAARCGNFLLYRLELVLTIDWMRARERRMSR